MIAAMPSNKISYQGTSSFPRLKVLSVIALLL